MRALLAALGILISTLALLFFWVGSQTFLQTHERWLALAMTLLTGLLLVLSLTLLFTASVQRAQSITLAATIALLAVLYAIVEIGRS